MDEKCGHVGSMSKLRNTYNFLFESLKGTDNSEDLVTDEWIRSWVNSVEECGLDVYGLEQETAADSFRYLINLYVS
jgi:hypothetical protein